MNSFFFRQILIIFTVSLCGRIKLTRGRSTVIWTSARLKWKTEETTAAPFRRRKQLHPVNRINCPLWTSIAPGSTFTVWLLYDGLPTGQRFPAKITLFIARFLAIPFCRSRGREIIRYQLFSHRKQSERESHEYRMCLSLAVVNSFLVCIRQRFRVIDARWDCLMKLK